MLDRVNEPTRALQRELDPGDRVILDSYLSTVREIERRIERASQRDLSDIKLPEAPIGTLDAFDEQVRLIFDLIALAYRADLARVLRKIGMEQNFWRQHRHYRRRLTRVGGWWT